MSENIVRVKKDARYFVASNVPFNDIRLSWEARGIMGYLLSKPDEWQTRMSDLVNQGPAGLKVIRRVLAELRKYGYMSRKNVRGKHGHFTWITTLYESPELNKDHHISQTAYGREAITEAPSELGIVSTDSSTENSIEDEADKKPTVPEGFPIEWLIAHGNPVDQAQIDKLVMAKTACDKFEQVFAFHSLPWSVNGPWEQFERWVVKIYSDYPTMFQEYVDWRNDKTKGGGFYKAMSNKQIRTNPLMFIDTGYPEFEAGKMYQGKGNSNGKNSGNAQKTPQPEYTEEQLEQGRRILARQRERAGETGPG